MAKKDKRFIIREKVPNTDKRTKSDHLTPI